MIEFFCPRCGAKLHTDREPIRSSVRERILNHLATVHHGTSSRERSLIADGIVILYDLLEPGAIE